MKSASQKLSLALLSATTLLLAGCPKKPQRPSPDATAIGQGGAGGGGMSTLNPTTENPEGLTNRNPDADANGQIRGKLGDPVYFAFDRSEIRPGERSKLQNAKDYLDKNPQYRLLLEGHCDWRGTAEYNLALGDRRANSAKKYLTGIGVSADKVDTLSKGSEEAVKDAKGDVAAKDRRVDLVLLAPGAAPVMPNGGGAAPAGANTPPPATTP